MTTDERPKRLSDQELLGQLAERVNAAMVAVQATAGRSVQTKVAHLQVAAGALDAASLVVERQMQALGAGRKGLH